jgi:hypothetical protein
MITRYRNWGIVIAIFAIAMSVLFLIALRKSAAVNRSEWSDYLIAIYLGAAVLWSAASYYLARAKGYDSGALGKVLVILLLLGFCCQPAALVFPFLGFFLKDQTQSRGRSHRRRRHHES